MKKVKFTFGLMLSMLFVGASVNSVSAQMRPTGVPVDIDVSYSISASPSYHNSTPMGDAFSGYNDAIEWGYKVEQYSNGKFVQLDSSTKGPGQQIHSLPNGDTLDIREHAYTSEAYATGGVEFTNEKDSINYCIDSINCRLSHFLTIKLAYENGKEVIPFVKRTITYWNRVRDTVIMEDLILAYDVLDKTKFTDGTGVATYKYNTADITSLVKTYWIKSIHYEIWTNDELGENFGGGGHGNPGINRSVTIGETAAGMVTNPIVGLVNYVSSGENFTFEVSGEAGKDLIVSTNDGLWTEENGGVQITPLSAGKWNVTIVKVRANLSIEVGYKTSTESSTGGEEGQTANVSVSGDAVWASGGALYVKTANVGMLSVYTVTGQLYKQVAVSGSYTTTMPKGLYIVQLNGKAYKVVL